ncbi:alpha-2-macroglobulin [Methyloradius palustris]|uniref:Alpha-2-macroglobulin n=1 Tax=Methyloradius palustris TaxID=2778876 RepID=A0A8D5GCC8_9PROT|nr:alpha-2-macroglobulin [Methyloradius palustris]
MSWQAPRWSVWSANKLKQGAGWVFATRKRALSTILPVLIVVAGGYFGWHWYQQLPKPVLTAYEVKPPSVTIYDENNKPIVYPFQIAFAESVAPVNLIGKPVTEGIKLSPKIAGEWAWDDEKTLVFRPKADWPVDAKFDVSMDKKKLLAEQVKLDDYDVEFRTAPFSAEFQQADFYQDPIDPNLKKLVSTVHFSHPVDADDLKARISIKLGGGLDFLGLGEAPKFTVSYDKLKLNAYIHSAPLSIPKEDTELTVKLDKGVRTTRGGNKTENEISKAITVPGLYSLRVNDISMTLVDNERFEPEQILLLGSSANISDTALAGKVHAWLLPEFNPKTEEANRTEAYRWYETEVTKDILATATPVDLKSVAGEDEYSALHSYKFKAPVGRRLYIKVDAGLQAFGGYVSRNPALAVIEVQPYPKAVKLLSQGALLSLSGERKLGYMTRGLNGVKIEIGRMLPNQLHHLVDQNYSGFAQPNVYDDVLDTLVERFEEKRPLAESEFGKPSYDSLDFGKYLREKSSHSGGVFMIKLQGYDPKNPDNEVDATPDTRFILVTDIGIIAKQGVDGSQDVFVQSIATGQPVANAKVDVIGRNGEPAMSQTTDATGHVHFDHLRDLKREKQAIMYLVTKDSDMSFLPINRYDRQLNLSRFDIGGIDNAISGQQLSAYAFTDRGIYRPGETAHIAMIARTANWSGELDGVPLEAEVTDPRGLPVYKQRIKLSPSGFESFDFASRETSATGDYQVGIYLVTNDQRQQQIGSASFKVRDFEPDRIKVTATLADHVVEGWIKPEEAKARIKAMHLFSSPANDRRVEAEMTLTPSLPAFAKYKDYTFQDRFKLKEPFNEKLPIATTDTNGEAEINLNLQRFARATYRLYLSAKVFEAAGGRSVAAEAATLVSAAPYLVGVKTDGALNYIPLKTPRNSNWLAIDSSLKPVAADKLTQLWIERKFVSVLVKQANGTYHYESRKKETVRESTPYTLPAGGAELALNTSEPGDFALVLKNAEGAELNRIEYSVAGQANLSRSLERNAELQLSLNKADYTAGDTMEISIRAPYVGAGLITIERDKVYQHVWFKTTTTSSVQKITLPKDFEGNGYVSVQFVRDPTSDEIFMSPLSYGVVPFVVNMDARREPIKVVMPDIIKPGQMLEMKVSTQSPARVVVFAVDEGILQVARYKQPDPIGFFFQKRALQVGTTQILDLILPEFQRLLNAAAPGGDGDAMLGRHLNPFKKKRQPPVAYWSGIIDVGANGKTLQYQVPDSFNGKLHIYAVAVTSGRIGVFDGGVESRGDLILSPNVPVSVSPGDEFMVSVSVFNNLRGAGGKAPVSLSMAPSKALAVVSAQKVTLDIAPQQEAVAEFRIRANDVLGSADLKFVATTGDKQGKASDTVGIRPAVPFRTLLTAGQFSGDSKTQDINRSLYAEKRKVEAGISTTPLVWAQGLSSYLGNYQYSCTEQLVSKGIPALLLNSQQDIAVTRGDLQKVVQTLRERQNEDGSFGLWSANMQVSPFASIYAIHYLLEAKDRGMAVPADMLNSANQWLQQYAVGGSNGLSGVRNRAYAIYLLTRQGIVTSGMLATLQKELDERYSKQWPQDLTAGYLAASYKLMQQDALAAKLLKQVDWASLKKWNRDTESYSADDFYFDPTVQDAQMIYLISRHFADKVKGIPEKVLVKLGETVSETRYNSLSAAYLIMGFDAYARAGGNDADKLTITELTKGGTSTALPLTGGIVKTGNVSINAAKLQFGKQSDLPAFYLLSENGYDKTPPTEKRSDGLEISREFTTIDGKPLVSAKVGEEFLVKLSFRSTDRDNASQIAIVDILPGGIEPVLNVRAESTPTETPQYNEGEEGYSEGTGETANVSTWQAPLGEANYTTWQPEYADIREDRVVLYGTLGRNIGSFVYRVRATNAGKFQIPAPFAEGMYDRKLQGRGAGGKLEITKP